VWGRHTVALSVGSRMLLAVPVAKVAKSQNLDAKTADSDAQGILGAPAHACLCLPLHPQEHVQVERDPAPHAGIGFGVCPRVVCPHQQGPCPAPRRMGATAPSVLVGNAFLFAGRCTPAAMHTGLLSQETLTPALCLQLASPALRARISKNVATNLNMEDRWAAFATLARVCMLCTYQC
jgi:hypothetical protein